MFVVIFSLINVSNYVYIEFPCLLLVFIILQIILVFFILLFLLCDFTKLLVVSLPDFSCLLSVLFIYFHYIFHLLMNFISIPLLTLILLMFLNSYFSIISLLNISPLTHLMGIILSVCTLKLWRMICLISAYS